MARAGMQGGMRSESPRTRPVPQKGRRRAGIPGRREGPTNTGELETRDWRLEGREDRLESRRAGTVPHREPVPHRKPVPHGGSRFPIGRMVPQREGREGFR